MAHQSNSLPPGMDKDVLQKISAKISLDLHPSKVANVMAGVQEQLNTLLLRYSEDFDGFVLSYNNVKILTQQPQIHPYFPYFHLDIKADLVVFKPKPGSYLVGRVNSIGQDYIGLLVLGVINASISADNLGKDFKCDAVNFCWNHRKHSDNKLEEDTEVRFKVVSVKENAGYYGISGSLKDPGTGALTFLQSNNNVADGSKHKTKDKNHKKRKDRDPGIDQMDKPLPPHEILDAVVALENHKRPHKDGKLQDKKASPNDAQQEELKPKKNKKRDKTSQNEPQHNQPFKQNTVLQPVADSKKQVDKHQQETKQNGVHEVDKLEEHKKKKKKHKDKQ